MPNCFNLTRIGESEPTKLQTIDDMMRAHFGAPADPVKWYLGWYNSVGFALAVGKRFSEIKKIYRDYVAESHEPADEQMVKVIEWLEENFESNAWAEIGRR